MSWFQLSNEEKIKKLASFLQTLHSILNTLMILWLIILAGFIIKVVHLHNLVEGWDLSQDPVDLWIGLGVVALLFERAFERMQSKEDRDGKTTS